MGHLKVLYHLLLMAEVSLLLVNSQGTKPAGAVEFNNGNHHDVDDLIKELEARQQITSSSDPAGVHDMFSAADQSVQNNPNEQNYRNVFSRSKRTEFIDMALASQSAQTYTSELKSLVEITGIDPTQSFDVNGSPTDTGVMLVSAARLITCPYNKANLFPCHGAFREPTARCTHLEKGKKTWGMASSPYTRVLPAAYQDGINERRKLEHSSQQPLTSPRDISAAVTKLDVILNTDGFNAEIMQWGQFVGHDITHIPESLPDAACCPDQIFAARHGDDAKPTEEQLERIRKEIELFRGDICMQIETLNDSFTGGYLCMAQTRTLPTPPHNCSLGPRQQMNAVTHVIDGSGVYGSSISEQHKLRDIRGGRMKTQTVNGAILPPPKLKDCEFKQITAKRCPFMAGDTRINQTPNLASTHTIFLIKHNEIADKLATINPHWDNERLFQETRRIITGIITSVQYYEYLPLVIGSSTIKKYKMDRYSGFNKDINPSVLSEMAHAAYRFGHSTIDGIFRILKDDSDTPDFLDLTEQFNNNTVLYEGGFKQFLRGLQLDQPWIVDRHFPTQMRNSLFDQGKDIVAFNINRGRDHGFSSYVDYRQHYGLSVPKSFSDLRQTHPDEVVDALSTVYTTVADMELYIAGVTEKHLEGAIVGELFANIIGEGFFNLMAGDRLFFEGADFGLTAAQIQTIKEYKYNKFLCDTVDMPKITSNAFKMAGSLGATEVDCSSLPDLDLNLWKEDQQRPLHGEL